VPFLYQLVENHFAIIRQVKFNNTINEGESAKVVANLLTATSLVPRVIIDSIVNKLAKDPDVMPVGNPQAEIRKHTKLHFKVFLIIPKHSCMLFYSF
jgi:malic enzyme